jgi:hypothetical protein
MIVFDPKDEFASDDFRNYMYQHTSVFCLNIKGPTEMMPHRLPGPHFVFRSKVNLVANNKPRS